MITLDLGGISRARIWLTVLPEVEYESVQCFEHRLLTLPQRRAETRRAAIELSVADGGRWQYGLLGAEFTPESGTELRIQVSASAGQGRMIPWSLAAAQDQVRVGLPAEYAEEVLGSAVQSTDAAVLGSGRLEYRWAAHGEYYSSPRMFEHLATRLILLLLDPSLGVAPNEEALSLLSLHISDVTS